MPFEDAQWTNRSASSYELIAYPSAVHLHGGNEWSNHFVLFYLYLEPGADFTERYLMRRHVWVHESGSQVPAPQVRLRLSKYFDSQTNDHWVTTSYAIGYQPVNDLGWIMTADPGSGAHEIYDLYIPAWNDHFVGTAADIVSGVEVLRKLGWVYSGSGSGRSPLYRYFDSTNLNHYLSLESNAPHGGTLEFIIGYALDH